MFMLCVPSAEWSFNRMLVVNGTLTPQDDNKLLYSVTLCTSIPRRCSASPSPCCATPPLTDPYMPDALPATASCSTDWGREDAASQAVSSLVAELCLPLEHLDGKETFDIR